MPESPYAVVARGENLARGGQVDRLESLTVIPRYNGMGTWTLSVPAGSEQAAKLTQVAGVIIHYGDIDGPVLMSGPVTQIVETWDRDSGGAGMLEVSGVSDDIVLADRLAWPNPGSTIGNQTTNGYDRRSGVGETVIKEYVDNNAGPSALADRQVAGLTIETDGLRGSSVEGSARMAPLHELITDLASSAGLGWRVVQSGSGLVFEVFEPQDRTGTARFGRELGNLISYKYERIGPQTTRAIVGGGGEDTARVFRQVTDSTAETDWGRKTETFRDARDTTDTTELDQRGAEQLTEEGPQTSLAIQTVDTEQLRFGSDYGLGDRVTVEPGPGHVIADVLREVQISWTAADGPTTTSQVGTRSTTGTDLMIRRLARLTKKLKALEAKR